MPNTFTDSRVLSAQELSRLAATVAGTYVFPSNAGGAVTSNANMVPSVAAIIAGRVVVNGTRDDTGLTATTVTVTAAHATNPRRDLIWYDGAGAVGVTAGTAAAAPVVPDLTAGRIAIYEVYVAALDTSIDAGDLSDRRANVFGAWRLVGSDTTEATMTSATAADMVTITGLTILATAPVMIVISCRKSSNAFQPAIGLKINATTVVEPVLATTGLAVFSATAETQNGVVAVTLSPRRTNYDRGVTGMFYAGGATAGRNLPLALGQALDGAIPVATITDVIIRGDSDGTNTLGVQGVYVYEGL